MKYLKVMFGNVSGADKGLEYKINEVNIADKWNPNANTPEEIKKAVLDALDNVKDSGLLKMISDIIEKQISNIGK